MQNILLEDDTVILNVKPLNDLEEINQNTRLFFELNNRVKIDNSYHLIKTGYFKEIKNPLKFKEEDELLKNKNYIKHHNFVIKTK